MHALQSVVITSKIEEITTLNVGMALNYHQQGVMSLCKLCKNNYVLMCTVQT